MSRLEKRFPRYSKLLRLYPEPYRKNYSEQILQTLADMLDNTASKSEKLRIWVRLAIDFPATATIQNVSYLGGIMAHETPKFVWRNGLIGGMMLLPFCAALLANSVDQLVNNHSLYGTWLWKMPLLSIWVLWLPLIAAILGISSLLVFLHHQRKAQINPINALLDFRYNWPLTLIAISGTCILALVFFHDSIRCVTGNPVREIHNPTATWHCIEQR
jgi:hypothetical protein